MISELRESLYAGFQREFEEIGDQLLTLQLDVGHLAALVANLQLALRHPANTGATGEVARTLVDGIIAAVEREGRPALAALLRAGDDPAFDTPEEAI